MPMARALRWSYGGGGFFRARYSCRLRSPPLVEDARLVGRDHILDVDEGILAPVRLQKLQRLLDEVAEDHALPLVVHDPVANVDVAVLEDVQHRENLAVVGHERLPHHLARDHQLLQHLEDDDDDDRVAGVEGRLDRDDQLRDHWQDLGPPVLQHVECPLDSDEAVGFLLFAQPIEEDGQVMVVVQLLNVHLPLDLVADAALLDEKRQVPALVEPPQLGVGRVLADLEGSRDRRPDRPYFLLAHRQRRACAARRVLVNGVPRALERLGAGGLGGVQELCRRVVVVRVLVRVRHPRRTMPARALRRRRRLGFVEAGKGLGVPIFAALEHGVAGKVGLHVVLHHRLIGSVAVVVRRKGHCGGCWLSESSVWPGPLAGAWLL
mmetsp:Transcript_9033/g.21117  ORF Transcript_9033/g.21117 Transcript_9033/m.21117 type:complete len:379 (-) Transcript_9033:163-1299(-)